MPPCSNDEFLGNDEDKIAKLLKQLTELWIDGGEDKAFEETCKLLGNKIIQDLNDASAESDDSDAESDDEECDPDADEVLNADRHAPDSEDDDDGTLCCTKAPLPPTAVQLMLDGPNQEESVKKLKAQCNKLRDPAEKLEFLTKRETLVQGCAVTPITYSTFTNKSRILKYVLDELSQNCGISLRNLAELLDKRDRDGNNLLLAMTSSQLDLSEAFKVLFNFQHYPHKGKKYFLVNHLATNQKGETIFNILERNGDISSGVRERIRKSLQELIERPEFETEWIVDVLSGASQLPVEDSQNNKDRLVRISQCVSNPNVSLAIRHDSLPDAPSNPEQELEVDSPPDPAANVDEEDVQLQVMPLPVPDHVPEHGPAHAQEDNPAPELNLPWTCSEEACGVVHLTKEEAQQCAQSHGGEDVLQFDEDSFFGADHDINI